jgi:hypothetical protein
VTSTGAVGVVASLAGAVVGLGTSVAAVTVEVTVASIAVAAGEAVRVGVAPSTVDVAAGTVTEAGGSVAFWIAAISVGADSVVAEAAGLSAHPRRSIRRRMAARITVTIILNRS